jgi:hypothetical protein
MFDAETIREVILLKAHDLGLEDSALQQLNETICAVLEIEDADPIIFPDSLDNA